MQTHRRTKKTITELVVVKKFLMLYINQDTTISIQQSGYNNQDTTIRIQELGYKN